jgi:PKD repeat protein
LTVEAPPPSNTAPTITWTSAPNSVASGQSYTISAHGRDVDGNLTNVNVYRDGAPFAFAGGGTGSDSDSGNTSADTGPLTITYTAEAIDAAGARSGIISRTVTIAAAVAVTASISASPSSGTAPATTTISWTSTNAVSISVAGTGLSSASANGSQSVTGLGQGTHTFTIVAQGPGGPATDSVTVTVSAPANSPPTIAWNTTPGTVASGQSYSMSARGHDNDGNLSQVNVWKNGAPFAFAGGGNGTDSDSGNVTSDTGPATITFTAQAVDANGVTSATITQTVSIAASNSAPTIAWTATPGGVASGQPYTISARGHDADGNLSQVNIWKAGAPFAFVGGGNGTDSDSGNATSDVGPATITFTAQAVDSSGATSATITQTVTVAAANAAPTIAWTNTPGSVANGQSYTISARGHDADGNLSQVNVWKAGAPFAFAGGGNGTDGDSGNTTSDSGPATITFTANAVDSAGATSSTISQTVTVAAPATVSASINANPTSTSAPGSTTITWSSTNASSVTVSGTGLSSAAASGTQTISGLTAGSHTYAIIAQGNGGPVTQSATVTVAPASAVSASISASPNSVVAPGSTTISWTSANATAVVVTGNGLNSTAASGSQNITGLGVGSYNYTVTAQGPSGPATETATVTVTSVPSVSGSISASPSTGTEPASSTISWTTSNASSVSVNGPGLASAATDGTQIVSGLPAGTHTYTLIAQGSGGPVTQSATVTVVAPASVTASITASPVATTAPGVTTITWSSANATSVTVSGSGLNSTAPNGSQLLTGLPAGTYSYTITAQGPNGPATQTATFTVNPAAPTVSGSIAASPTTTTAPGSTTLTWTTADATSVFVTGPGVASTAFSGTQNVTGLSAGTHTFSLTAQGNGGPITRTVTVTVNSGASVTAAISVAPLTLNMGGTATLTWTTTNATSVRVTGFGVTGSPYQTAPNLMMNVSGLPPGQYTWTLVAEGPGGPLTRTATANVNSTDGLYGSLTTNPAVIYSNQTATLAWTSSGTNIRWVHGQSPGINGVNIYPAASSGSASIAGLSPGEYSFIFEYGPGAFTITRVAYAYLTVLGVNRTVTASVAPVGTGAVGGAGTYREGSAATLTATPDSNHLFSSWSGDISSTSNPLTFTVGAQNYSVVANFVPRTFSVSAAVTPVGTGTVTGAGAYTTGATAVLLATPAANHTFIGWSGDATGSANPISLSVTRDLAVSAQFAALNFLLTTAVSGDGTVTPGGSYPPGTLVTLAATSGATSRFTGWAGDATGSTSPIAILVDRDKVVQANFLSKNAQTISFPPIGDRAITAPPFGLLASASSGLPVDFAIASGPALLAGTQLQVTGAGPITVRASQDGDAFYLPAPSVEQTFNAIAPATLRYRGEARTILQSGREASNPPRVIQAP